MRSRLRNISWNSAGAIYLNKVERIAALRESARRAATLDPTIRRVLLFGSMVNGIPTRRSDADILVEVESSHHLRPRDRVPGMLGALSPLPCAVDLFVLTTDEVLRFREQGSPLLRIILCTGVDLLAAAGASTK